MINIHSFFTVESKQVAQQEAQRAAFVVDRAIQERQQKIVQAEGEAQAAAMLGESLGKNPGYLKLRKLNASKHIAKTVSEKFRYQIMYIRRFQPADFAIQSDLNFANWTCHMVELCNEFVLYICSN